MLVTPSTKSGAKRKLSSPVATVTFKFFLPAMLLVSLVASAIEEYSSGADGMSLGMLWPFFMFILPWMIFIFWLGLSIKSVAIDDSALYVSNYFKEVRIPLAEMGEIREARWMRPNLVTVVLKSSCKFGDKIRFVPIWGLALSEIKRAS